MVFKSILKLSLIFCIGLVACNDDDDTNSYSFKDQNLSGKIEGVVWTYDDGKVNEETLEDELRLSFRLFTEIDGSACEASPESDQVLFTVPNGIGLYKLNFNLSTFSGQVVNLFDYEETFNNLATEGAIEILTITETMVIGRIDARIDKNNFVNGNFSVSFCAD